MAVGIWDSQSRKKLSPTQSNFIFEGFKGILINFDINVVAIRTRFHTTVLVFSLLELTIENEQILKITFLMFSVAWWHEFFTVLLRFLPELVLFYDLLDFDNLFTADILSQLVLRGVIS